MNRRGYLATVAAVAGASGCLAPGKITPGSNSSDSPLTITAPTVAPGETGTISITAQSARILVFRDAPDHDRFDIGEADFSPSWDMRYDSLPPTWHWWSSPTAVSGGIGVSVAESTPAGSYTFEIGLRQEDGEDVFRSDTLTVEEDVTE